MMKTVIRTQDDVLNLAVFGVGHGWDLALCKGGMPPENTIVFALIPESLGSIAAIVSGWEVEVLWSIDAIPVVSDSCSRS